MNQSLLTVLGLSSFLNLHPNTIYKWKDEGRIPYCTINGQIRFKKPEIEKWLENKKITQFNPQEYLPKCTLSLEIYDKIYLKGESAVSNKKQRWKYGFGGVYTRKTKSGLVRWCVWYYDEKRHRVQKVIKNAKSRQDAIRALHLDVSKAFDHEYRNGQRRESSKFLEFSDSYLKNYAKPKKKSWKSDMMYLNAQLIPFFGEMLLSEITPLHVNKFMVKRQQDGVRNSTINRELTVLKKMLGLAIEWNFDIESNPVKKGNYFPEEEYKRERVLSPEEEKKLFKAAAPHLKAIISCALSTGMRFSEILGLKWTEVDLEKKQITVSAKSSKSGKQRVIPINSLLFSLFERQMELNAGKCDFVFLYEDPKTGKLRPITTVRRAFTMACKRAGIKNLTFHDLRHTFGSRLIERGADPVSVKDLLGHANLKTTEIYLHSSIGRMREAVSLLEEDQGKNAKNLEDLLRICNMGKTEKGEKRTNVFFSVN